MTDREKAFFVLGECQNNMQKANQGCLLYNIDLDLVKRCREEITKHYIDNILNSANK